MKFSFRKLVLVRHGECQHNAAARYAGQYDSPLTRNGFEQAQRTAALLESRIPEVNEYTYISSPLSRARTTAEIILNRLGRHRHSYTVDDRLLELNYGEHTSRPVSEVRDFLEKTVPPECLWQYIHPNGESAAQLHRRIGALLTNLPANAVLVCHSGSARMVRAHILGLGPNECMDFKLENGAALIFHNQVEKKCELVTN